MDFYSNPREFFKQFPRFYYFIMIVFGPACFLGLSPKQFLKKYPTSGTIINIGSGPRKIQEGVINIDIISYPGVDLISEATEIKLPDKSISRVISDNVLEHVANSDAAIEEIYRLLKPNGMAYIAIPFLYPYHAAPSDFNRFTEMGLRHAFRNFEIIELGIRSGPFSTFTVFLCYFFASLFSIPANRAYPFLINIFMFIFFPIKFLDIIGNHFPHAIDFSSILFCVIKKPATKVIT